MDILGLFLCALRFAVMRDRRSKVREMPSLRSENSSSQRTENTSRDPSPACGIQPTLKRHRSCIERTTNRQRKRIEPATKAHPTSWTIEDNYGQFVTMDDNCDRARG